MNESGATRNESVPHADAVLEMFQTAEQSGAVCALLTPAIKANLKALEPGQVLLVRVDDPSASLDVQAWCGLTGNTLLSTRVQGDVFSFFIRKQDKLQEVHTNG